MVRMMTSKTKTPKTTKRRKKLNGCLIIGGSGYLGTHLMKHLLMHNHFQRVVLADINAPKEKLPNGASFLYCDVRNPLANQISDEQFDWIFNFAAVHREPGHEASEYFDTNVSGANNVCAYAEKVGCENIFFSSSIAVYGEITSPVSEESPTYPNTPYGISKLYAELVHSNWADAETRRKLAIIRPGVIYGPGDPGNMLRMIRAIRIGIFVMPINRDPRKSYGYIYGLLDSIVFAMGLPDKKIVFNYVEKDTEKLSTLVSLVKKHLSIGGPTLKVPFSIIEVAAGGVRLLPFWRGNIHPMRVRKMTRSTHVVPKKLLSLSFPFNFDFETSLTHWNSISPEDFI